MGLNELSEYTIEIDIEDETYRVYYEKEKGSPSLVLVDAIATIEEVDPVALESLSDNVDGEALDTLIESATNACNIAFSYQGYRVTIRNIGSLELRPFDSHS